MQEKLQILSDIKESIKSACGKKLKDLILFGSQATGKATKDSDFDILIILSELSDKRFERELSDICYEIELKYNILIDALVISESELFTRRGKKPIYINAINTGVRI